LLSRCAASAAAVAPLLLLLLLLLLLQGGPERLSRHAMALGVARHCQLDAAGVVLEAKSGDVVLAADPLFPRRGCESPPDISMSMERLLQDMPGIVLTPFSRALAEIWG
jgi:hypothetical protein